MQIRERGKENIDEMTDVDQELLNILQQYQEGKNAREIKEEEIIMLKNEKRKNISGLIKYVTHENDSVMDLQLVEFLQSQNTLIDNKTALRLSYSNQNYHKTEELLVDVIDMSQTMDIDKKAETEDYVNLQLITLNAERNFESFDSIINANADFLFEIAADTMRIECAQAQTLLEHAGLAEYPPVVYPPVVDNNKSLAFENEQSNYNKPVEDYLKVYPNPVKDNLFVEYDVFNYRENEDYRVEIVSQEGKAVRSINIDSPVGIVTINIRNFTPGNYFIKLNNKVVKFTKM